MIGDQLSFVFEEHEDAGKVHTHEPQPGKVGYWPYPEPCPWRERCINYQHFLKYGTSCSGEYAVCNRGQLAAGRTMPEWQWKLLSPYARNYLKGVVLGDPKALKALKRSERAMERMYEQ